MVLFLFSLPKLRFKKPELKRKWESKSKTRDSVDTTGSPGNRMVKVASWLSLGQQELRVAEESEK